MSKSSGGIGSHGGLNPGDGNYKGSVRNVESLKNIKQRQVYNEVGSAISRYHAVLGVRQREIKLADLSKGTLGVHVTSDGKSEGIYLNKKYFNQTKRDIVKSTMEGYKSGWHTKTNKPMAHTVTHELAHATWNSHFTGEKYKRAGQEIKTLSARWLRDRKKTGYGKYASTNLDEFWAETVTKAVHGKSDYYTNAVKKIIKRYKL